MGKKQVLPLRVDHGPIPEDIIDDLNEKEKEWLRNWNRHGEIPGEEVPAGDEPQSDSDYLNWSNDELREELERRDLPKSGNKEEMAERLEEDDNNPDDEDDDEE